MNKKNYKLNPYWIIGFTDAEGCFTTIISKEKTNKIGWKMISSFQIKLYNRDKNLIIQIKFFFNNNTTLWKVFFNYTKTSGFFNMKKIVFLIDKKEHLNQKGLVKIVSLRAFLNKRLSNNLKFHLRNLTNIIKPYTAILHLINSNWVARFYSEEGSFSIQITKSKTHKLNYRVFLSIKIGQHIRIELLIKNLINIFNCGFIFKSNYKNYIKYNITKFINIYYKITSFFQLYKIKGIKFLNFLCKAAKLIEKKTYWRKK